MSKTFDRKKLRIAAERDINLVLAACLPQDFASNVIEPRMVTGCMHPVEELVVSNSSKVLCRRCFRVIDPETAAIRVDEHHRRSSQ